MVAKSLFELMEGKTVIAIAHRLSTIASLDRLVVMEQGALVESGTHSELVANGRVYANFGRGSLEAFWVMLKFLITCHVKRSQAYRLPASLAQNLF